MLGPEQAALRLGLAAHDRHRIGRFLWFVDEGYSVQSERAFIAACADARDRGEAFE